MTYLDTIKLIEQMENIETYSAMRRSITLDNNFDHAAYTRYADVIASSKQVIFDMVNNQDEAESTKHNS